MRISDWSSDVCSSDLCRSPGVGGGIEQVDGVLAADLAVGLPRQHPGQLLDPVVGAQHRDGGGGRGVGRRLGHPELARSEESRVGKESVSTCRSGGSQYISKKKQK